MAEKFCSLFPRRDVYIRRLPNQDDEWRARTGPLLDKQILDVIADGGSDLLLGCRWDVGTRHAVLDVDAGSQYHNKEKLAELLAAVTAVGLEANIYQSSETGGWHLYLPFQMFEGSTEVEATLKRWLKALGFEVKGGQLEIFPSGNALRLPLQCGFAWLNSEGDLIRSRKELRSDEAIKAFMIEFEASAKNWSDAKNRIESQISLIDRAAGRDAQEHQKSISCEGLEDLFDERSNYKVIPEYCERAREYLASGLTKVKTRHEAIYTIQHLLWHGDSALGIPQLGGRRNLERRYQFLRQWIEANHNGYCQHINRGDWKTVEGHIRRICSWKRTDVKVGFRNEPYIETERAQDRLVELRVAKKTDVLMDYFRVGNERREGEARVKIKWAVDACLDQGRQVSRKTLEEISGCSPNTVRKHSDLWKHLATGSGVLISGGLGPYCSLSEFSREAEFALASESDSQIMETSKEGTELEVQDSGNAFELLIEPCGKYSKLVSTDISTDRKISFILPYGSQRRPILSLGRLLCKSKLKRVQRKSLLSLLKGGAAKNSSLELAPIVLTPVFLLPGYEPSSEPPASRPSPTGSFGSLDAGSLVHCYSVRTANDATGSRQAARTRTKASRGPPAAVS